MDSLCDRLAAPETRTVVVDECVALVSGRVAAMAGVRGMAMRLAHDTAGRIRPQFVRDLVERLLPDFAARLEPWYRPNATLDENTRRDRFRKALISDAPAVSLALLEVADRCVQQSNATVVDRVYRGVRASAQEQVAAAVPNLAEILARYV